MLRITRKDARLEALAACAARLWTTTITRYEGDRISECDEETCDAFDKVNEERRKIARALARQAGVKVEDLGWEED